MTVSLGARPTATVFEVEDLVGKVWSGQIRIPEFQRPLRWGFEDVRRLFDSILRGYPLGSLLLWERHAERERLRVGALDIDAPATDRALWVVDGQQRVTALANVLSAAGAVDDRFALSVNLIDGRVVRTRPNLDSTIVPLPVLFDLQQLLLWFRDRPEAAEYFEAASAIAKTIRQAKVPASVVVTDDEEVLRDIFDRLNNYGKRLTRAEVFAALHPAGAQEENTTAGSIAGIAAALDDRLDFGVVDGDTILRAVLARRGADITREIRIEFYDRRGAGEFARESVETAYHEAEVALEHAVRFLQQDAGVPHFAFLPYRYLLVVLTRVFAHHDMSGARERQLLRRWFWRAAAVGPTGSTTETVRALCSQVIPSDLDATMRQLLHWLPGRAGYPDVHRFRTNHAAGKIIACSMWSSGPRSLRTLESLDQPDLADALGEARTPRPALTAVISRGVLSADEVGSAGRWLLAPGLDAAPSEVSAILAGGPPLGADPHLWTAMLTSHAIDRVAADAIAAGDNRAFVRARTVQIRAVVEKFLDTRWEYGFEDTVSLDRYVMDDLEVEDPDDEKLNADDTVSGFGG
ncbi:MAG: DUF262 domain-containing protein [Rhodococcus sp. (in: high G+C Gram-positive bacteria)]|uniref:DUF262 domain-containing protein n=1 Tax=Rhodococcus sp. TaxID=1831 RepID=UPI003BB4AFE1